jgi:hypothetical protein
VKYVDKTPRHNKGYKYVLVVVDIATAKIWAKPLKTKNGDDTAAAIDLIVESMPNCPRSFASDDGGEFSNQKLRQLLYNKYGMFQYRLTGRHKAYYAEHSM